MKQRELNLRWLIITRKEQWLYVSKELAGLFKEELSLPNAIWAEISFRWKSERNFRESWRRR